jgi:hypothetical protein
MGASLPISNLINVSVNLSPQAAQMQNISDALILGNSQVIDTIQRIREYTSLTAVEIDFGSTAPEYLAAVLWFEQVPQPTSLFIGRWAQTATPGQLIGATLPAASQLMSAWTGITAGSFDIAINGGSAVPVTGMNFSVPAVTTMQGVAAVIQTAVDAVDAGVDVVWNSVYEQFQITSSTTGSTSAVAFLTAAGSGTDISALMGCRSTSSGAYVVPGLAAETAVAAATLFDNEFGQQWYALAMPTITADSDHVAVATFINGTAINGTTTKHLYGITTQEAGVLVSTDTSNIAYQLQQLNLLRSIVQYSSSNPYAVVSLLARALTVDYSGNSTTITLMYKQEPGIVAETLNQTQLAALEGFNCNVFVAYNTNTAIIQSGVVSDGNYIDVVTGTDWLALDIQTSVYNLLYQSQTKIPQTDAGTNQIVSVISGVCAQAVINGLLAPGTWTVGGFGSLQQGQFLPKGYYIYAPPVSSQSQSQRGARISVPIQIAAKLAGAVQTVNIAISVNS